MTLKTQRYECQSIERQRNRHSKKDLHHGKGTWERNLQQCKESLHQSKQRTGSRRCNFAPTLALRGKIDRWNPIP